MRSLSVCVVVLLAACQSADVELHQPEWPDGMSAEQLVALAEAAKPVIVVQSIEYGSGEATAALADGAAEAIPLAVTSQTSGDAGALAPMVPATQPSATAPGAFEVWRDGARVLTTTDPADVEAVVGGADP